MKRQKSSKISLDFWFYGGGEANEKLDMFVYFLNHNPISPFVISYYLSRGEQAPGYYLYVF